LTIHNSFISSISNTLPRGQGGKLQSVSEPQTGGRASPLKTQPLAVTSERKLVSLNLPKPFTELLVDTNTMIKRPQAWRRGNAGLAFVLAVALTVSLTDLGVFQSLAASPSVLLEDFRWNRFPLKVLAETGEWSSPDYIVAVRDALDSWVLSIQAYGNKYSDKALPNMRYAFYVGGVNSTSSYDVIITFSQNAISGSVGETVYRWNPLTHEPIPPVRISITTYSRTARHLFVRNVAMHELGHAVGLGHATSEDTADGPELMYYRATSDQVLYPSTLDLHALSMLYQGSFGQSVYLPSLIPYNVVWPLKSGTVAIIAGIEDPSILGAGSYPLGTMVTLKAPESVLLGNETRLLFSYWEFPDIGVIISTPVTSVVVDRGNVTVVVDWRTEYYVEVTSAFGPSYSRWMSKGSSIYLDSPDLMLSPDWSGLLGVRYRFVGWTINGQLTNSRSLYLNVDGPLSVKAVYESDYMYTCFLAAILFAAAVGLSLARVRKYGSSETQSAAASPPV